VKTVRGALAALALTLFFAVPAFAETEAEANYRHEWLDKGYKDWRDASLRLQNTFAGGELVYVAARQTERFSLVDDEYIAGVFHPVTDTVSFTVEANCSPTHQVLPRWAAVAGVETTVRGWGLAAGYKRTEYDLSRVDMGVFRIEKYAGNFRGAYTYYPVHVDNAGSVSSHAFRMDWFYDDRSFAGIGYATGREAENDGASGTLISDIEEYSIVCRHWLARDWALAFETGTHRQSPYYTRNWVSIGIRRTF